MTRKISYAFTLILAFGLAACATGNPGAEPCDPTLTTCPCQGPADCPEGWHCDGVSCALDVDAAAPDAAVDASVVDAAPPEDAAVDAAVKLGFGEPCTDRVECLSNICILIATGGFCSTPCPNGTCPDGYGCYGVLDAIEQGQVGYVCVPTGDMLCTACETSPECSLIGQDLCLDYGDGKQFCGRDCRTVECPAGYTCTDLEIGGNDYRQCIPDSGYCDCGAINEGTVEACDLTTPFGVCGGTRTCGGATGWGECLPPSPTDAPDATFTDDDCDGIDGDLDGGIYVSTSGQDVGGCGTDYTGTTHPFCRTVTYGIDRAFYSGLAYVYVQAGSYSEVVVLRPGIHVYGGYDDTWQRDDRGQAGHTVTITGTVDAASSQFMTVKAHDINSPTTVADLVLVGPTATGAIADGSGHSSYVVHVNNATGLVLERVTIQAGTGAGGYAGGAGTNAGNVDATANMHGGGGGAANEYATTCNDSSRGAGGAAGTNTCGGGLSPNAGGGGTGGTMDSDCSFPYDYDCTNGNQGGHAAQNAASTYGWGGGGGACTSSGMSGPGVAGLAGRVQNGAAGSAGNGAYLVGVYWYAYTGTAGGLGQNGGGGGGGGGSGGSDNGTDSYGAGGGGGGAGGCAAPGVGGGGGGGGGSFGVFAVASTVTVNDCAVVRGNGGAGGAGGIGGRGQSPGSGGNGGTASGDSSAGGAGARGGHGGHSGGGGGGAGGSVYAFYGYNATITQTCTISSGSAGSGGAGGAAANAPVGENDGNAGATGTGGNLGDSGSCSSTSSCQ